MKLILQQRLYFLKKMGIIIMCFLMNKNVFAQKFYIEVEGGGIINNKVYMPDDNANIINNYSMPVSLFSMSGTYFFSKKWGMHLGIDAHINSYVKHIHDYLSKEYQGKIVVFNDFYESNNTTDFYIGATYRHDLSSRWALNFKGNIGFVKFNPFNSLSFNVIDPLRVFEEHYEYSFNSKWSLKLSASAQISYNILDFLSYNLEVGSHLFYASNMASVYYENTQFQSNTTAIENNSFRCLVKIQTGISIKLD